MSQVDWINTGLVPPASAWHTVETGVSGNEVVYDYSGNNRHLTGTTNLPVFTPNVLNGEPAMYFDGTKNPLVYDGGNVLGKHIFVLASYADATFSGLNGILSATSGLTILTGAGATTSRFFDNTTDIGDDYLYRKNDVNYALSNQLAPMSGNFALMEIIYPGVATFDGLQIGQDRSFTARRWKGYFVESIVFDRRLTNAERRGVMLYFNLKYALHKIGLPFWFPSPDITDILYSRFYAPPLDYDRITDDYEFEDGSKTLNEFADEPPKRWQLEANQRDRELIYIFDKFWNTARKVYKFLFRDKYNIIHDNVRVENYSRSHEAHKSWIEDARFDLVRYPGEFPMTIPDEPATLELPDTSPTITTLTLPNAINGFAYNQTIHWTGGNAPFTVTVPSGSLPSGISFGTPGSTSVTTTGSSTTEGDSTFTVRVTDVNGDYDEQAFSMSVLPVPEADAVFVHDGDSREAQTYFTSGNRINDAVAPLLVGVATVHNIAVGGGALNTGSGDLNLTASLGTRLGSLFDGGESKKIILINSSYNDLMGNITPAQYMTKLQGYIDEAYAQGATDVIVFSPSESDYIGQRNDIHAKNRLILDLLKTEFSGSTPFGNANTTYINISSNNTIGLEADTHDTYLYYEGGGDLGKLHYGTGHNEIRKHILAERVKRIAGAETTPSIPTGLKVTPISDTEIEITIDPAFDKIPVTYREYRLNGDSPENMDTNPITVSGLTPGTSYSVEVRAGNDDGVSDWCDAKTVYTYPDFTGWTPASLTGEIWLKDVFEDTARTNPATVLNDAVKAFEDESASYHFTEATNNPVFKPATIGSLDGIYFDGTNDKLSHATAGGLMTGDFTWIIPIKASSSGYSSSRIIVAVGDITARENRIMMIFPFTGFFAFVSIDDISTSGVNLSTEVNIADGNPHILTCRKTGTLVELFIDKEKIVTGRPDIAAFTSTVMRLGALSDDSLYLQGHIGESILVPSSLSDLALHYAHYYLDAKINGVSGSLTNWALPVNGGTASASNSYTGFDASNINDGFRSGLNANGAWLSIPPAADQWVRIIFNAPHPVEEINVIFPKDNFDDITEPTLSDTTSSGATNFLIKKLVGATWTTIATVTGNDKVWYQHLMTPEVIDGIEVFITVTPDGYKRMMELEAKG